MLIIMQICAIVFCKLFQVFATSLFHFIAAFNLFDVKLTCWAGSVNPPQYHGAVWHHSDSNPAHRAQ